MSYRTAIFKTDLFSLAEAYRGYLYRPFVFMDGVEYTCKTIAGAVHGKYSAAASKKILPQLQTLIAKGILKYGKDTYISSGIVHTYKLVEQLPEKLSNNVAADKVREKVESTVKEVYFFIRSDFDERAIELYLTDVTFDSEAEAIEYLNGEEVDVNEIKLAKVVRVLRRGKWQ